MAPGELVHSCVSHHLAYTSFPRFGQVSSPSVYMEVTFGSDDLGLVVAVDHQIGNALVVVHGTIGWSAVHWLEAL